MSGERPALSIIIVAWNVADYTEACIQSIFDAAAELPIEILLVDNASSDDVQARVRARFPAVRIISNELNVGFPRANNQALTLARGRHTLFLNPDTTVGPGCLARCVAALDADRTVGVVGCRLDRPDGSVQYECGRHAYRLRHLLAESLYLHMFFPTSRWFGHHNMGWWDHRDRRDVEAVSGAFLMVRTELARTLGGLPEDLFMYHEDLSFCLRVRRQGLRIRFQGDVWTVHHEGRSSARSALRLELLQNECRIRLIEELEGSLAAGIGRFAWGLTGLARLIVALLSRVVPGAGRARTRWPRVFDVRRHALQLVWAFAPLAVRHLIPRGPGARAALADTVAGVRA
jgi:GT2 family glycosyltransferase